MVIRTLAHLAMALVLVGCACTQMGCNNLVAFSLPFEVEPDTGYAVRACIDDRCEDAVLTIDGRDLGTAANVGALALWGNSGVLELRLGDSDFPGTHRVTLSVRDQGGALVADFEGDVELTRTRPNGTFCDPTCWSTEIDL